LPKVADMADFGFMHSCRSPVVECYSGRRPHGNSHEDDRRGSLHRAFE